MDNKKPPIIIGVLRYQALCLALLLSLTLGAQNSKIKCYFNHPVNTAVSTGTNALYLNTTFDDTLIAYINRAQVSIDLCVYNYYVTSASDVMNAVATAINNAYSRGVTIRWIGNGTSSNNGWANLNANIQTLSSPTTSSYGICHNKFVVFDVNSANSNDAIVWTGSYNFTRQQNDNDYNNVVIIQDKNVATAYYNEFNKMWGGTGSSPNTTNSKFGTYKTASAVNTFTVNGTPIEVYFSPKDNTASHLRNAINTANSDLFFGIYTFTDTTVANRIKNKYNLGIPARGIMDQFSNTYTPYTTLNATMGPSNLEVYSNNTYLYHNKIMLIDALNASSDPQVCTGSFNWSLSATNQNDENMIVIHDAVVANQYYQSLCKNFTDLGGASCPMVGLEEYDFGSEQVAIFPNPASEQINIQVKNAGLDLQVSITDLLGNKIKELPAIQNNQVSVDIKDLAPGVYFFHISRGDGSFNRRFIKQ